MIELRENELIFSFPEIHPKARLRVGFQRTLRIPDDDKDYPLPPGLGRFPLRHTCECRIPGSAPAVGCRHQGYLVDGQFWYQGLQGSPW